MFWIYTLIFSIIMLFITLLFKNNGKSLIWTPDGLKQHIVSLKVFREMLIEFIKTGQINLFTWNIGNGYDLFSNFTYYVLGDIASYICILFPENKIELAYNTAIIIRMYSVRNSIFSLLQI